MRFIIL